MNRKTGAPGKLEVVEAQSGVRRVIAQTDLYGRKSLGLIASWNLVRFD